MNILLGVTGSVATTIVDKLYKELSEIGKAKIVATDAATHFINKPLARSEDYYNDSNEWSWWHIGDPICHIELKDWADIFVIAPLTANTLAKMAYGLADNLLTCVYRGYPIRKPLILAPAMNTDMWNHPTTHEHIGILERRHDGCLEIIEPIKKKLACGTTGIGAMADIKDIVNATKEWHVQNGELKWKS